MSFVPHASLVTAPDAHPGRWMLVLHGILGMGSNFRTLARRLTTALPAWGVVLVDLRMHGQSQGAPPPQTLHAARDDLLALEATLPGPVRAVLGHSFGGKVALAFAALRPDIDRVFVLDSPLGTRRRASTAERVIAMLRDKMGVFPSRAGFVESIVQGGHTRAIADWLAMNLRPSEGGVRFGLDLGAIDALLESYARTDLWSVVAAPPGHAEVHVAVADRSDAFDASERARLAQIAAVEPRTRMHLVADAGHWIHVDAPDAVFELVRAGLASVRA